MPRWHKLVAWGIIGVILLGFLIDGLRQPVIYIKEAQAEEVTEPKEVVALMRVVYDKEGIERLIRETFPETPNTAVAIAMAESELNHNAVNPEAHRGCNGSYGVFQIACVHHRGAPQELKDVELNIKKAREIYLREGWKPWGAYTDGRWEGYLE